MKDLVQQNKESYDKIASLFSQTRSFIWEDLKALNKYVKTGDKVLDVGCGNGRLLEILSRPKIKYLGVDFSQNLLLEAQKKYSDEEFRLLDILDLDQLTTKFDVVFFISALNHFPREKHAEVMSKISHVMEPGAELLMVNWNMWNWKRKKSVWHNKGRCLIGSGFKDVMTTWKSGKTAADLYYYAFSRRELRKLLEKSGFDVVKNYYSKGGKKTHWLNGDNIVTVAHFGSNNLEKKKSEIHGTGVFAKKDYKKGDVVYRIPMRKIKYSNYKRYAYVGNGQYVNDEVVLNFVNHSCHPNIDLDIERPDPVLTAITDIKAGDEIVCNYDFTEKKGVYNKCLCGRDNCKGFFGVDKSLKVKFVK